MSVSILQKSCVQNNSHPQQPKSEILPKALGTRIAWKRLLIIVYGASNHENKHACFFKRTSTVSSIYRVWVHFYKIWTGLVVQHDHPGPFFSLLSNSVCWSRVSGMEKNWGLWPLSRGNLPQGSLINFNLNLNKTCWCSLGFVCFCLLYIQFRPYYLCMYW